jgi:hypothetical protein|tara:strand:+ start:77 stop:613 length:537 start_codon:yes stop_codon:yes gene_type:complete
MFYLLIVVAAASRFLPHPPNVACVTALGMFAGCYLVGRKAYLVPLAVLLISDLIGQGFGIAGLGFYSPVAMLFVYAGALSAVPVGRWIAKRQSKLSVPVGALAGSCLFFAISNLGIWFAGWYPMTAAGFIACFTNAIPFFGYSIAGDLAFSALLFGAWEWSGASLGLNQSALAKCRIQ